MRAAEKGRPAIQIIPAPGEAAFYIVFLFRDSVFSDYQPCSFNA